MQPKVPINITNLNATITEGIELLWNGFTVNSGPLKITLDNHAHGEHDNRGELDYQKKLARAQFNVLIALTGITEPLKPPRAVLRSQGEITEDHNFGLSGPMEFHPHPLFGAEGISAMVLPGR